MTSSTSEAFDALAALAAENDGSAYSGPMTRDAAIRCLAHQRRLYSEASRVVTEAFEAPGSLIRAGETLVVYSQHTERWYVRTPLPPVPVPPSGDDLNWVLQVVEVVDRHLDDAAPEIYRTNPLANRWRRIAAGPASEGQEAVDALNLATGGNPRKGVIGDDTTVLGELGDSVGASILAIQSITKDTGKTWDVVLAALVKALSRVPEENRHV
jgi:hypothetical protein